MFTARKAHLMRLTTVTKTAPGSVASEYQWAAADNVDVVAGISHDWRDSLEGMKHEKNGSVTHYDDNNQSAFNWQMMTKYHFENSDTLALSTLTERVS